ncbi:MAG: insulinase family protein [Muribaculaceae bacterium]|nr:insulinase family protein [Muribaculaceae bacterium]MBR0023074.1 insulinase family protein [Muribaculaceae bacterium]
MKRNFLSFLLIAALGAMALAQEPVPADTAVRTGTLPNGLTYYVKQNNYPEHRADFFIAQRVGSLQEQESQRGLAHFLEHMCFNGTKHFPGNSLITYMESIGVKFGANLNAYTSTDETVYNISNVPTERRSALDSCFLVLADWAQGLTLDGKEIDKERGVIEGEWRHRTGANYRLLEKSAPALYQGSLYGERMPIGLMSVVKNFKHKELRNYYKQWYHPSNQCIIVVGDIDPAYAVGKIVELFGNVKNPKNAKPVEKVVVPDNEEIISCMETDREQSNISVRLMYKHGDLEDALKGTTSYFKDEYLKRMVASMLNSRLSDLAQQPNAPFTSVHAADRSFMLAKSRDAFQLIAMAKSGKVAESMQWMSREVKRAQQYGFTEGELRRARLNYESAVEKMYRERDKYSNTSYCRDFVRAYLEGEPIPSFETQYNIIHKIMKDVTLADVNAYVNRLTSDTERNVVLLTFAPESEAATLPSQDGLIKAYREGRSQEVEAYVDKLTADHLLPAEPVAGKIVATQAVPEFDAEQWTLSNGVKVLVKPTTIKAGEVVIAGTSPGGLSQNYRAQDAASFKAINSVMALSGYGEFMSNDMKKVLAGKDVKMRTFVSKTEEGFQGSSSRGDLETAMQLLYLKLTSPQKDENAFNAFLEQNRTRIANQNDPKFEFADSIFANVFCHHPLGAEKLTLEEIDQVNYDRILEVYRDRFADVSDMTVYLIGDFDRDSLMMLTERYIAALPGNGRIEKAKDIGYHLFSGDVKNYWTRKMETAQDKVYFFWTGDCPYNARNVLLAKIAGQVFTGIFRDELRENRGWTYHVDTHCSLVTDQNGDDGPVTFMPLNVTVTAGKGAEARDIIEQTIKDVAAKGITTEQLLKVKKYYRKVYNEDIEDNTYWMAMMRNWVKNGVNLDRDYLQLLDSITVDDVRNFVARYINTGNRLILLMEAE